MKLKDLAIRNLEEHEWLIKKYKEAELTKNTKDEIEYIIKKSTLDLGQRRIYINIDKTLILTDFMGVTGLTYSHTNTYIIDIYTNKLINYLKSEGFTNIIYSKLMNPSVIVIDV